MSVNDLIKQLSLRELGFGLIYQDDSGFRTDIVHHTIIYCAVDDFPLPGFSLHFSCYDLNGLSTDKHWTGETYSKQSVWEALSMVPSFRKKLRKRKIQLLEM